MTTPTQVWRKSVGLPPPGPWDPRHLSDRPSKPRGKTIRAGLVSKANLLRSIYRERKKAKWSRYHETVRLRQAEYARAAGIAKREDYRVLSRQLSELTADFAALERDYKMMRKKVERLEREAAGSSTMFPRRYDAPKL